MLKSKLPSRLSFRRKSEDVTKEKMFFIDEVKNTPEDEILEYKDILSFTIICQLWHISDNIFKNMDAVTLLNCEKVCDLWKNYLMKQKIWQKCVERFASRFPSYINHVGWWRILPQFGGEQNENILVYRHTYWKMTNLNNNWSQGSRSLSEQKKIFHRSGPILWKILASSGRAVSVYNSGKGFIIKIHDQLGFKFRCSHYNGAGTINSDTLCMDATDDKIVVAGYNSQKVWVFNVEEEDSVQLSMVPDFLVRMSMSRNRSKQLVTKLTKFIAATGGVSKVQLHSDSNRLAVLLPHNHSLEIWNINLVTRLYRFTLTPDATYLVWKKDILAVAPLYSGVVQVYDTNNSNSSFEEMPSLVGAFRKIDSIAVYEDILATAETRIVKLWKLSSATFIVSWTATKTFISSLFINDTMLVTGSGAGIVKIWSLAALLGVKQGDLISPLRRINMKGIHHYPIKEIFQCTYTDLVIIAKYEGKKKKDKVKVVEVKWN